MEAIDRKDLFFYVVLDKLINGLNNMPASYSRMLHVTKIFHFSSLFLCFNSHISLWKAQVPLKTNHQFVSGWNCSQFSCFQMCFVQTVEAAVRSENKAAWEALLALFTESLFLWFSLRKHWNVPPASTTHILKSWMGYVPSMLSNTILSVLALISLLHIV